MSDKKAPDIIRSERYIVDGKEYHSLSEIPESERKKLDALSKLLEDKNKDGVLDVVQKNDSRTSYMETREVRVSSSENTEKAGDLLHKVLQDLAIGPLSTKKQAEADKDHEPESPLLKRQQDERRSERIRHYILILALVAVVVYLLLKQP